MKFSMLTAEMPKCWRGAIPHAVECSDDASLRLEHVTLFASNCFGFLEVNCDGTVYVGCRIDRRPPEDDPVKRASARLRSPDADACHSKHAIKGSSYLECSARFMGDDCINICGDYHMVMALQGRSLRVLAKGQMNIQPGDPVELVLYSGERLPDAVAVAVEPSGSIRDDEKAFLARQALDANLKSARGLGNAFTITRDREVAMVRGGILCSARRVGNNFAVRNCNFGFNRSRGILIKASHGEITGNHLEGCRMSAILVAPEYWWLEAGSSTDLDHADMAYEWLFNGINSSSGLRGAGPLPAQRIEVSGQLKALFPAHLNSLGLRKADGTALTLDANGDGPFKDYVKSFVIAAAQRALKGR
jgi:hypothetical protein